MLFKKLVSLNRWILLSLCGICFSTSYVLHAKVPTQCREFNTKLDLTEKIDFFKNGNKVYFSAKVKSDNGLSRVVIGNATPGGVKIISEGLSLGSNIKTPFFTYGKKIFFKAFNSPLNGNIFFVIDTDTDEITPLKESIDFSNTATSKVYRMDQFLIYFGKNEMGYGTYGTVNMKDASVVSVGAYSTTHTGFELSKNNDYLALIDVYSRFSLPVFYKLSLNDKMINLQDDMLYGSPQLSEHYDSLHHLFLPERSKKITLDSGKELFVYLQYNKTFETLILNCVSLDEDSSPIYSIGYEFTDDKITPTEKNISLGEFFQDGNRIFFSTIGHEKTYLWVTDGTEKGSRLLYSYTNAISTRKDFVALQYFAKYGEKVVFDITQNNSGEELGFLITDGTKDGTSLLKNTIASDHNFICEGVIYSIVKSKDNCILYKLADFNTMVYKKVLTSKSIEKFAKLDRTIFLKCLNENDIVPSLTLLNIDTDETVNLKINPEKVIQDDGLMLFTSSDEKNLNLWISDATQIGTKLLLNTQKSMDISVLKTLNNNLLLRLSNKNNAELWSACTDGSNTQMLLSASQINAYCSLKNKFFFYTANELYSTDSSPSGTLQIMNLQDNILGEDPKTNETYIAFNIDDPSTDNRNLYISNGIYVKKINNCKDEKLFASIQMDTKTNNFAFTDNAFYFTGDNGKTENNIYVWSCAKNPLHISIALSKYSVQESDTNIEGVLKISMPMDGDVTIPLSFSGTATLGEDFDCPQSITIPAGQNEKSFVLTVKDDSTPELDENVIITISLSEPDSFIIDKPSAELNIINNDGIFSHIVTYSAEQGGVILGCSIQIIEYGKAGSPVQALPLPGYRFLKWNDGNEQNFRKDLNITEDAEYIATFEKLTSYKISGTIKNMQNNSTLPFIYIGGKCVRPDSKGVFSFDEMLPGEYTVVPCLKGFTFSPRSQHVVIVDNDAAGIDFSIVKLNKTQCVPDAYAVAFNSTLIVPAPGILKNDKLDSSIEPVVKAVELPKHGKLHLSSNGAFSYSPEEGFEGKDYFTYKVYPEKNFNSKPVMVTLRISALKVTIGSIFNIPPSILKLNKADSHAKLIAESLNGKLLALDFKNSNSLTATWKKRYSLIKMPLNAIKESVKHQAQAFSLYLLAKENGSIVKNQLKQQLLLVPPVISDIKIQNNTLTVTGDYFGSKCPRLFLKSQDSEKKYKCKPNKKRYVFDPATGRSSLNAKIKLNKLQPGKYALILFNKIGVGVLSADDNGIEKIPVVEIK